MHYILMALQIVAVNPSVNNTEYYSWSALAKFANIDECSGAINQMIGKKRKLDQGENYICVKVSDFKSTQGK